MATELERVAQEAAGCTRCRLAEGRSRVVFARGNPRADVMLVGEAPGFYEDRQGKPFVGPSGRLLTRLLAGIGLGDDDVYVTNVVKCRPPGNRDPQPDEIEACRPYLDAQLRLVDPKVVLALGNFASKTLLATTTGITRLRGRAYPFQGRVLIPTFHPAAALRAEPRPGRTSPLEAMEQDVQLLARTLAELRQAAAREASQVAGEDPAPAGQPGPEQLGLFSTGDRR